ncbi:hypothetical protein IKU74_08630 [bacterium]|nr:hypothetical protein [bacterium]
MIRIAILLTLTIFSAPSFAFDAGMGNSTYLNPAMGGLGSTPAHDMQMINDLKQRYEIYNDVKENKQERIKKLDEMKYGKPTPQRTYTPPQQQNVQFIKKDGKLKIQSIQ